MSMIFGRHTRSSLIAAALLLMLSCDKSTNVVDPPPGETALSVTIQRVRHLWDFDRFVNNETLGSQVFLDTIKGLPGDYLQFAADNRAFSFWDGVHDTVTYQVLDKSHLKYGGDTFVIQTLTNAEFILHRSGSTDSSSFEHTLYLSK